MNAVLTNATLQNAVPLKCRFLKCRSANCRGAEFKKQLIILLVFFPLKREKDGAERDFFQRSFNLIFTEKKTEDSEAGLLKKAPV
jgi:hypothetical protein